MMDLKLSASERKFIFTSHAEGETFAKIFHGSNFFKIFIAFLVHSENSFDFKLHAVK